MRWSKAASSAAGGRRRRRHLMGHAAVTHDDDVVRLQRHVQFVQHADDSAPAGYQRARTHGQPVVLVRRIEGASVSSISNVGLHRQGQPHKQHRAGARRRTLAQAALAQRPDLHGGSACVNDRLVLRRGRRQPRAGAAWRPSMAMSQASRSSPPPSTSQARRRAPLSRWPVVQRAAQQRHLAIWATGLASTRSKVDLPAPLGPTMALQRPYGQVHARRRAGWGDGRCESVVNRADTATGQRTCNLPVLTSLNLRSWSRPCARHHGRICAG